MTDTSLRVGPAVKTAQTSRMPGKKKNKSVFCEPREKKTQEHTSKSRKIKIIFFFLAGPRHPVGCAPPRFRIEFRIRYSEVYLPQVKYFLPVLHKVLHLRGGTFRGKLFPGKTLSWTIVAGYCLRKTACETT